MAKKSRRVKARKRSVRLSPAQMVQPGTTEVMETSAAAAPVQPASHVADLQDEYRYVIADLKRIGIIAVAMLVVLVVLALSLT
jgi:hypothetical protein